MSNWDVYMDKDKLPSNFFKKNLLSGTNFEEIKAIFQNDVTESSAVDRLLTSFNPNLYRNFSIIIRDDKENLKKPKCCRNVNYYYDLLVGYIKYSKINTENHEDLFTIINEYWSNNSYFTKYQCSRRNDVYSTEKRCILMQIHDYYEDKEYLKTNIGDNISQKTQYEKYYQDKWSEILKLNGTNPELYFSIDCNSSKINGKYKEFLLSPKEICPQNYQSLKIENIKISTQSFDSASEDSLDDFPRQSMSVYGSLHQSDTELKAELELLNNSWSEIFLPVGFSFLGITLFSFIIYKFSPLYSWLHNFSSKNIVRKGISVYDADGLINNTENNNNYLLYHSVSH
ncbi:PIR protein [Plasmodium ovale]|uniref:PIR Superfamily Protein n=2 Tax=Plasmodium ovale TaxID=36330 RepID=A0A1A8WQ52_PLAOA|nr:PIR Superfamily Protein [Plasmodium ovale curtisi]SBT84805.1 PIR protein [Plasmodium ovale]